MSTPEARDDLLNIQTGELVPSEFILVKVNDDDESTSIVLNPTPSNDPNDPLNWSLWRKTLNYTLVFAVSVAVFTALSIQVNFWQQMSVDMGVSFAQLNNAQSANLAGLAVGCIFFIPLTRKYGRRSAYILSTLSMAAMSWWSYRMTTLAELYLTNLFYGLAGAINETIVQVTIADLFFVHQRGRINALYLTAVMVGSFLTPMAAGVQAADQGWRKSYMALSISLTILAILFLVLYEETKYVSVLQGQSPLPPITDSATSEAQNPESNGSKGKVDLSPVASNVISTADSLPMNSYRQRMRWVTPTAEPFWELFKFPLRVVILPHVLFTGLQYAACIIYLVILATVTSIVFSEPPYNFDTAALGYLNLAPFAGNLLGSFYAGIVGDRAIEWLSKRNHGWFRPEFRLYPLLLPVIAQAAGLIVFGVTLDKGMHWIYPSVGGAIFAFGLGAIGDVTLTLVIDAYRPLTADAFVGITFLRNAASIPIPFLITPWMENVGLTGMFITLGVIAFVIGMLFLPLILWGRRLRNSWTSYYHKLLRSSVAINSS